MNKIPFVYAAVIWKADQEQVILIQGEDGVISPAISHEKKVAMAYATECQPIAKARGERIKIVTFKRFETQYLDAPIKPVEDLPK